MKLHVIKNFTNEVYYWTFFYKNKTNRCYISGFVPIWLSVYPPLGHKWIWSGSKGRLECKISSRQLEHWLDPDGEVYNAAPEPLSNGDNGTSPVTKKPSLALSGVRSFGRQDVWATPYYVVCPFNILVSNTRWHKSLGKPWCLLVESLQLTSKSLTLLCKYIAHLSDWLTELACCFMFTCWLR